MVTVTKMTTKGQITVPKEVRDRLRLKPGDELEFVEERGAFHVRKRIDPAVFEKYRGLLKHLAGKRSDDLVREMRGE